MAQGRCDAVRRVGRGGCFLQPELLLDHEADLVLCRVSVSHDGLLDLARCVLGDGDLVVSSRQENGATGMPELQSALHVLALEHLFDGDGERPVPFDEADRSVIDLPNPSGEGFSCGGADDTAFAEDYDHQRG